MHTTWSEQATLPGSFWSSGNQPAAGAGDWGWGPGGSSLAALEGPYPTCNPNDIGKEPPAENMPVNLPPVAPCDPNGDASVCPPEPDPYGGYGEPEEEDDLWDDILEVGHGVFEGGHTVGHTVEQAIEKLMKGAAKNPFWGPLPPIFPKDLGEMGKQKPPEGA